MTLEPGLGLALGEDELFRPTLEPKSSLALFLGLGGSAALASRACPTAQTLCANKCMKEITINELSDLHTGLITQTIELTMDQMEFEVSYRF